MHSSNPILESHNVRFFRRIMAIALLSGTVYTSMAGVAFAQYTPPADIGLPSRREPGGTRGNCLGSSGVTTNESTLTPLMPIDSQSSAYFGQTVSPYPTFYWYVPALTARAAEFVLINENDEEIYTTKFRLMPTETGGLISLSLPENAGLRPLETNKNYKWYFSLICDEFDRGTDIYTEGWVRRVPEDPTLPLTTAGDYAEAGIWFEALEILAADHQLDSLASPEWEALLESVGLGDFTETAFLQ